MECCGGTQTVVIGRESDRGQGHGDQVVPADVQRRRQPDGPWPALVDHESVACLVVMTIGSTGWSGYDHKAGRMWTCTEDDLTADGKALLAILRAHLPKAGDRHHHLAGHIAMYISNLTPHDVSWMPDRGQPMVFPPTGSAARLTIGSRTMPPRGGLPCVKRMLTETSADVASVDIIREAESGAQAVIVSRNVLDALDSVRHAAALRGRCLAGHGGATPPCGTRTVRSSECGRFVIR